MDPVKQRRQQRTLSKPGANWAKPIIIRELECKRLLRASIGEMIATATHAPALERDTSKLERNEKKQQKRRYIRPQERREGKEQ
jgi:hypothetical protein